MTIASMETFRKGIIAYLIFCLCITISSALWKRKDPCRRVYFGSVPAAHAAKMSYQGVYSLTRHTHLKRPVYRHEHHRAFIYYASFGGRPHWAVGPHIGSQEVQFAVGTARRDTPDMARRHWRVRHDVDWTEDARLGVTCVDGQFGVCTTGKLHLSGLSALELRNVTGTYVLTDQIVQLRPIYKHQRREIYLLHRDGMWLVGTSTEASATHFMFAYDTAWRPELVTDDWVVFNTPLGYFTKDRGVRLHCEALSLEASSAEELALHTNVILPVQPVATCDMDICEHNSTCDVLPHDRIACRCSEETFGARCETRVKCPMPLAEFASLTAVTSQGFLGLAQFECVMGFRGTHIALVCGLDGTWRGEVHCIANPEVL